MPSQAFSLKLFSTICSTGRLANLAHSHDREISSGPTGEAQSSLRLRHSYSAASYLASRVLRVAILDLNLGGERVLWLTTVAITKYAALTYLALCISLVMFFYFRNKSWKGAFSVLIRENSNCFVGVSERLRFILKTIRYARFTAAGGLAVMATLMLLGLGPQ